MIWLPLVVNFWVGWWQIILNGSGNSYLLSEKIATIDVCVRFIELIISLIVQVSFPRAFVILQVIRVIATPTWWPKLVKLIPQIYWDRRGQPHGKQWSPWSGFLHDLFENDENLITVSDNLPRYLWLPGWNLKMKRKQTCMGFIKQLL